MHTVYSRILAIKLESHLVLKTTRLQALATEMMNHIARYGYSSKNYKVAINNCSKLWKIKYTDNDNLKERWVWLCCWVWKVGLHYMPSGSMNCVNDSCSCSNLNLNDILWCVKFATDSHIIDLITTFSSESDLAQLLSFILYIQENSDGRDDVACDCKGKRNRNVTAFWDL